VISQGYVRDRSGIWPCTGNHVLDIKKSGMGYPKLMKDILLSESLEWDIPMLMNDKSKVSFFILRYLSFSHPILVPMWLD
jgi:hypothetical protein